MLQHWKLHLALVVPMMVASLSDISLSFVDTAVVGRLGAREFAAVAAAAAAYGLASQIVAAAGVGHQILTARRLGAGQQEQAATGFSHAALLLTSLGSVGALVLYYSQPLAGWIAKDPAVAALAVEYLRYRSPSLVLFALTLLMRMTLDADRNSRPGMKASLLANVLNAVLTYILVFGVMPFPAMGVAGSALASTLASGAGFAYMAAVFLRTRMVSMARLHWRWSEYRIILRLSGPEILNAAADYTGNLVFVYITALAGLEALAGGRIGFMILLVSFVLAMNFGVGTQILVGRKLGEGDVGSARRYLDSGLVLAVGLATLPAVVFGVWPGQLAHVFSSAPAVRAAGAEAVRIVALCLPVMAWMASRTGALRAAGRTLEVMLTNLFAVWCVQLPTAWLLGIYLQMGLSGIYAGYLAYFVVRALLGEYLAYRALARAAKDAYTHA